MEPKLTGSHQNIYDALFRHPIAHNLHWRDVRSMLGALAVVVHEPNGNLKVTRNGVVLVLHSERTKDVAEVEELMQIRHYLQRSSAAMPEPAPDGTHLLVVIDHRQARIYKAELHGSVPQRITPYDPYGFGRNLHYVQDDSNGQRKPERTSFYEAVAKTMQDAVKVLVFGGGTGASSAMDQLVNELKRHHPELAKRVIGALVVNEQHLTQDQLLAKAREFYVHVAP